MKNLAGDKDADKFILDELKRVRIPVIDAPPHKGEVPYTKMGKLGDFEFTRAWYYWVVEGRVPLHVAQDLYEDPVGKTDIRVAGHCACPPPEEWADYYDEKDDLLVHHSEKKQFEHFVKNKQLPESVMQGKRFVKADELWSPVKKHDTAVHIKPRGYVRSYHIDSEVGLRIFTDAIKKLVVNEILVGQREGF
jgi:hypothetical protein